jgi:hypothetical protein
MKLTIIDHAFDLCDAHLSESNSRGTEVESYLTRYLLVLICAQFEEKIEQIVVERAKKSSDPELTSFVQAAADRIIRSINTSEISGLLNYFSSSCKEEFKKNISNSLVETNYNSIISNRHNTAHSSGANITFNDLKTYYESGHEVLDYLEQALLQETNC